MKAELQGVFKKGILKYVKDMPKKESLNLADLVMRGISQINLNW